MTRFRIHFEPKDSEELTIKNPEEYKKKLSRLKLDLDPDTSQLIPTINKIVFVDKMGLPLQ